MKPILLLDFILTDKPVPITVDKTAIGIIDLPITSAISGIVVFATYATKKALKDTLRM